MACSAAAVDFMLPQRGNADSAGFESPPAARARSQLAMESNKENQEGAAASVSVASPRVSSVGAPSEGADHPPSQPQAYQATVFSDHLHWGGVERRLHARSDARSVSSAAADRDDKSLYGEDVGALDAHTEGDEQDEDDDGEVPEELTLTQVQGELRELPQLRHEPSAVESAFTGISAAGSLADVVDQLADQAVAGELSPRQAAAAIRSATAAREGLAGGSADGSAGGAGGSSSAAAAVDALDGSESVASLPHRSSIAPSEDGWHGASGLGGSSTADMMDSIPLEAEAPPTEALAVETPEAAAEAPPAEQAADAEQPAAAAGEAATGEAAAEPAAAEDEAGEPQPQGQQQAEEEVQQAEDQVQQAEEEPALPESKSAHDVAAVLDAVEVPAVEEEPSTAAAAADEAAGREGDSGTTAGASAATAAAAAAAAGVARKPSGSAYRSRLMQQLTASGSEDDITVYSSADLAGGSDAAGQDPLSQAAAAQQAQQPPATAADAAVPPAAGGRGDMQPLSIANGSGSSAAGGVMPTQDTAKALAAINAAASDAPAGEGGEAAAQELLFPPQWYQTFKGLLYMDGVDSLGRPVVVLNADAVPANMKASALVFVKAHLEPLVNQGDYVLVFTSRGHARLPSMWIMGAYRSLPRPFRKNVQHVVLVRPSAFLRTVLAFMRPFVSKKAHRKIKQVQSVHDIAAATEGEVTLASLGPAFSAELLAAEEEAAAAAAPAAGGGVAPAAGGSGGSSP